MTRRPQVLVLVPAHDEEQVIQRGVQALLAADVSAVEVSVMVVANGCSDHTAQRARDLGDPRVEVVELSEGSKVGAVRHGMANAGGADVVAVVDADVVLDESVLPALAVALAVGHPRIAAPALRLDLTGCSRLVRRYYAAWSREPHVTRGDIGARGVYAVNAAGLERLRAMPDVVNDDGWARAVFAPEDRVVTSGTSTVRPARTWRAQVLRRARVLAGSRQLHEVLPPQVRPGRGGVERLPGRSALGRLREDGWLDTVAWYVVDLPARALEGWRHRRGGATGWGRDETSRATR